MKRDDTDPRDTGRYRLTWRFRRSGRTGSGPWMRRPEVVEAWLDAFSRRDGEQVEYWIDDRSVEERASR
jgi:hypothetical protein